MINTRRLVVDMNINEAMRLLIVMHNNKIKAQGSTSGLILYSQLPTQDPYLVTN